MFSGKMENKTSDRKLRGRSAIEAAHAGVSGHDETRLDATISMLYGVGSDEAAEIHTNYHVERIFLALEKRARENGMKREVLAERMQYLDIVGVASQVAMGKLAEAAAVDVLFRGLSTIESRGKAADDRYSNFYG
jgi:hypothetical protein